MAEVRFNLRNKKLEKAPIYLIYTINGKRLVYPVREKIPPNYWSDAMMQVKASAGKAIATKINAKIKNMRRFVYESEAKLHNSGKKPNKYLIRELLEEKFGDQKNQQDNSLKLETFEEYIDWFIEDREKSPHFRKGTVKRYKLFRNHWSAFSGRKKTPFAKLTVKLLEKFAQHLRKHKNEYSDNHIHALIKIAKTILNDAYEREVLRKQPHKSKLFKHSQKPADNIYLTTEQLKKIYKLKLPQEGKVSIYRDLFIVGAFTGLRYSDFTRIVPENIMQIWNKENESTKVIKLFMQKVNDHVIIPIHPIVEEILKKHNYNLSKYKVVNQVINRDLKRIGKLACIDEEIIKAVYRNGVADEKSYKKYELITTHTARRSFATNAYKAGIPAISIMKITGHKTTESFMKYICVDEEENAILMAQHAFFG